MTLPSRRKLPITALNTLRSRPCKQARSQRWVKKTTQLIATGAVCLFSTQLGFSQQWQPTRISPTSQAQPLSSASASAPSQSAQEPSRQPVQNVWREGGSFANHQNGVEEQLGTGVVLRWRSGSSNASGSINSPTTRPEYSSEQTDDSSTSNPPSNPGMPSNPLRQASSHEYAFVESEVSLVRTVSDVHPIDRFQASQSRVPLTQSAHYRQQQTDPLSDPESAPLPPFDQSSTLPDPPSFPPQLGDDPSPADRARNGRSDSRAPELLPGRAPELESSPLSDREEDARNEIDDDLEAILERARQAAIPDCVTQREQLKGQPLSSISLDISPKLGDGLRSVRRQASNEQQKKLDIESTSLKREWTDYRGDRLGSGRMIDLRFGNVILDVDGRQQAIPVANLSDVDMNYVSDLWNLPFRCGSGFEPMEGRRFVGSTVQWKASGACHNPLYFEQVQLERYGHETGPVLQPLISSAHYFLTIPMLPYKMAINPPNECQYALGYYRPGNCAPYMMQPFPWSVKAGLVQAGFWTGASALIP